MRHALTRTSPKGGPFLGTCMTCGRENLRLTDQSECANPAGFTQDETFVRAIEIGFEERELDADDELMVKAAWEARKNGTNYRDELARLRGGE